jgi:hypothetical protein
MNNRVEMLIKLFSIGFSPNRSKRRKHCRDITCYVSIKNGIGNLNGKMKRVIKKFWGIVNRMVEVILQENQFWFFPKPIVVEVKASPARHMVGRKKQQD